MDSTPANQQTDDIWLNEYKDELPTMLNILTILTIIFSAFSFLAHFFTYAIAPIGYRNATNARSALEQMPPMVKTLLGDTQEAARLAYVNRVPILLIGLVGALLNLFGALQMRKRKKLGFYLYIAGDALPVLSFIFFTVVSTFTGIAYGISLGIALVFIILYATQFKYMK